MTMATRAVFSSLEVHPSKLGRDLARLVHETVLTALVLGVRIHETGEGQPLAPFLADNVLRQRSTTITHELRELERLLSSEPDEFDLVETVEALGSDLQLLFDRTQSTARAHGVQLKDEFDALYRPLPTGEVAA
jgi:hypothetical protein